MIADLARGREHKPFHRIVLANGRKRTDTLRRMVADAK
jgi:ribosomal protein S16